MGKALIHLSQYKDQWQNAVNNSDEILISSKCRELFEFLRKCWLLQNDSAPWTNLLLGKFNNEKNVGLYTKSRKPQYTAHTVYQNITVHHFVLVVHSRLATEIGSNRETSEKDTKYMKYYDGRLELAGCGDALLLIRDCSTS